MPESNLPTSQDNALSASEQEQGGSISFPADLGVRFTHYTSIEIYQENNFLDGNTSSAPACVSRIYLPLPMNGMMDQQQYFYSDDALYAVGGGISNAFQTGGTEGVKKGISALAEAAAKTIVRSTINAATDVVGLDADAVIRTAIGAENPNLRNNFSGLGFKHHQFTWNLIPRSIDESESLRQIVNTLKYYSAPGDGLAFFSSPFMFKVYLDPEAGEYAPYDIGDCYLTDIAIAYNPSGQQTFFKDPNGAISVYPVEVQINLTFKEKQIKTRQQLVKPNTAPPEREAPRNILEGAEQEIRTLLPNFITGNG